MISDEQIKEKTELLAAVFVRAMKEAIRRAGSQKNMAEATGIHQSRISDYANGNYDFSNLTVGSLIRLFPELDIVYYHSASSEIDDDIVSAIENRMLTMFRRLRTADKVLCFEMMSRTFGDRFEEAEK